jgi:CRP/FNR family transcriptional regulator, cyclic AMP receptor protein
LSITPLSLDLVQPHEPRAAEGPPVAAPVMDHVALLTVEPSFAAAVPDADRALAERVLRVPRLELPPGAWTAPARDCWPPPTVGLLLLDGVVARHVALGDRVATHLLGPGDVLEPWGRAGDLLPARIRWSVHEPATAAVLDGRFATAARRWPGLSATVAERQAAVAERLATHLAICQLPRVEDRVLALLWHLAERFGRVASGGVVLPLRLTHRLVGELAGAQRPTVSLAFAALFQDGRVSRRDDGSLVLATASCAGLEPSAPAKPAPAPAPAVREIAPDHADVDLHERVRLLRGDLSAQRQRTIAMVTHSAALRRRRAALRDEDPPAAPTGDGAVPGEAA